MFDAVGIGFALSSILFIGRMSKQMAESHKGEALHNVVGEHKLPEDLANNVLVHRLEGPLFFGFSDRFRDYCESIDHVLAVVVEMKRVPFLDQSGIVTLESVIHEWKNRGIQTFIVGANASVTESMVKTHVIPGHEPENHCFDGFENCVAFLHERISLHGDHMEYEELLLEEPLRKNRANWQQRLQNEPA